MFITLCHTAVEKDFTGIVVRGWIRKRLRVGFQVALVAKNWPAKAGDIRDSGSVPGVGRSPGGRHRNPLQCSCRENPMDRGAWRATVHSVAKTQIRLK